MKKLLCLLLAILTVLGMCACGGNTTAETTAPTEATLPRNIMQKADPAEDDTLNILLIGSSFCYYYVEELWALLDAAGIKAKVCNVYYSGCPLEKHYLWWKSGEANYEFYVTDENGRNGFDEYNLDTCLMYANWDVISLQESSSKIRAAGVEQHLINTRQWRSELWGYIKKQFPLSNYYWQQQWSYQIGYDRSGLQVTTAEQQAEMDKDYRNFALAVCEEDDLIRVNPGEAWAIARQNPAVGDVLCKRLSVNIGEGDYYHDGDIGGGQYLNACVWFEVITGQSCIGNTYRPIYKLDAMTYELEESMITALQESAHQAVLQLSDNTPT